MVTFPPEFVATRFPGYFWNTATHRLFTLKVTGVLRPLKYRVASKFNKGHAGYSISVEGRKRYMRQTGLMKLKPRAQVVPVQMSLF